MSSSPKICLDKIARPVVLCSYGERPVVLTNGNDKPRSTAELHAAWLEERNVGVFAAWWRSVRRRRLGDEHLAERRLAELPDARLRDLVDELEGVR